MSYNCGHNYSRSYIMINKQLLIINNTYTLCEITGNTRVQNRAIKQQTQNCLTFQYSGHEADLPPVVKYLIGSTVEHHYDN